MKREGSRSVVVERSDVSTSVPFTAAPGGGVLLEIFGGGVQCSGRLNIIFWNNTMFRSSSTSI